MDFKIKFSIVQSQSEMNDGMGTRSNIYKVKYNIFFKELNTLFKMYSNINW